MFEAPALRNFLLYLLLLSSIATGYSQVNIPIDKVQAHVNRAQAAFKDVTENNKFKSILNGSDVDLPIGVKKTVGNKDYVICLDSIVIKPTHAYAVLYMVIEDPEANKTLTFGATNVLFTKDGGFTGDAKLQLLETYEMKLGPKTSVFLKEDQDHDTYVIFDCNGFKRLHIDADVQFSRDMIVPELSDGSVDPVNQVRASFSTEIEDWTDWIVELENIPTFQVAGVEGVSFSVQNMAFDKSDLRNPSEITYPEAYNSPDFIGDDRLYWQGFYMKELQVKLPRRLKRKGTSDRITLTAYDMIIDKMGFSGYLLGENLISTGNGDLGGWDFSIDYFALQIEQGTLTEGGMGGGVSVPITKDGQDFGYTAMIRPGSDYQFSISVEEKVEMPLWGAGQVTLKPSSTIQVTGTKDSFVPRAILNGDMSISASINNKTDGVNDNDDKKNTLDLLSCNFQKLIVKTTKPYISIARQGGAFDIGSPLAKQKLGKLPITISQIGLKQHENGEQTGITLNVKVNLVGESESGGGFSGDASLIIWGKKESNRWKYHRTELSEMGIAIDQGSFHLDGRIKWFRGDVIYGTGWSGEINARFEPTLAFKSKVMFGKKDVAYRGNPELMRYWYVDALVEFPKAIPEVGFMRFNAFGGGAFYRMKIDQQATSGIGSNLSGITYVPDPTVGLGLKAMLGIQGQTKEIYNGQVEFQILFNRGGGINNITFSGYVKFLSKVPGGALAKLQGSMNAFIGKLKNMNPMSSIFPAKEASSAEVNAEMSKDSDAGVMAQWRMEMDFENRTFTANIDIYVNIADGVIKGVNGHNHAGRIDILFSPSGWHVYIGVPTQPIGVELIGIAKITAYIVTGSYIPPPAPLPGGLQKAADIDFSKINTGGGFGFGARFGIDMGDPNSRPFYFYLDIGVGFDILLLNVKGKVCNESGKSFGVNNFFAMGQAYMYLKGGAGLKICWWKCRKAEHKKKYIHIGVNISLALLAQVTAPNPTYASIWVKLVRDKGVTVRVGQKCTF